MCSKTRPVVDFVFLIGQTVRIVEIFHLLDSVPRDKSFYIYYETKKLLPDITRLCYLHMLLYILSSI